MFPRVPHLFLSKTKKIRFITKYSLKMQIIANVKYRNSLSQIAGTSYKYLCCLINFIVEHSNTTNEAIVCQHTHLPELNPFINDIASLAHSQFYIFQNVYKTRLLISLIEKAFQLEITMTEDIITNKSMDVKQQICYTYNTIIASLLFKHRPTPRMQ